MTKKAKDVASVTSPTSGYSFEYLSGFIDTLLKKKHRSNADDYSDAIARLVIAKSCRDELQVIKMVCQEIYVSIYTKASTYNNDSFSCDEIVDIITEITEPIEESLLEKIDEMEHEMDWVELSKFKEICGE